MGYRVVAPLVYLKVPDAGGAYIFSTFYAGALVPDSIHPDSLQHHLESGLVVDEGDPAADVVAVPAGTPIPGEPPNAPVSDAPAGPLEDRLEAAQKAASSARGRKSD